MHRLADPLQDCWVCGLAAAGTEAAVITWNLAVVSAAGNASPHQRRLPVFCLHICLCTTCVLGAAWCVEEEDPLKLELQMARSTMWELRIEFECSAGAASTLNH